ncbi:hypothetical protein FOA52_015240 [Chlamydomonas sp. UWO 241]|nr:hypothetical protein FOA52_015240 [Chlamydomonas sp. UWO 241]
MDAALVRFQALTSRFGRELAAASTSEAADTGARANGAAATAPAAAAAAAAPAAKATGGKRKSPKRSASTGTLSTADGTAVASDGAGGSGGGAAPQSQLSLDSEPEFIAFAGLTADDDADASAELLAPTPLEVSDRERAVAAVRSAVHSIWPDASVEVFGSFATGLYVPTSDVDLVVLNTQSDIQRGLKALANKLSMERIAQGVQVLAKARVPIIKFETVDYGNLAFDISFDVPNGPQAAVLVKDFIGEWPMLRPLVLVLKLFLQQRELNEVYTGGIGSYALITLLIAFLQLHNSRRPAKGAQKKGRVKPPASPLEPCLGVLLIDFFRLYGRVINTRTTGVSATGGGHYFNKEDKDGSGTSWLTEGREYMLSVEDPKDATNDICRSSFNIMRVRSSFDFAYQQVQVSFES